MDTPEIVLKTGSNAVFHMVYADDNNQAIDISNYEIFMDFVDPKTQKKLAETSVNNGITITDGENGTYTVDAGSTATWPLGKMPIDIRYTNNSVSQHTDTFILRMIKGIS